MARKRHRPAATRESLFEPQSTLCWECGKTMWIAYAAHRTVTTLDGVSHLTLKVRRCHNQDCPRYHQPYRPEEEGRWVLPHGKFGLDVIALVGALRYEHQGTTKTVRILKNSMINLNISMIEAREKDNETGP